MADDKKPADDARAKFLEALEKKKNKNVISARPAELPQVPTRADAISDQEDRGGGAASSPGWSVVQSGVAKRKGTKSTELISLLSIKCKSMVRRLRMIIASLNLADMASGPREISSPILI